MIGVYRIDAIILIGKKSLHIVSDFICLFVFSGVRLCESISYSDFYFVQFVQRVNI